MPTLFLNNSFTVCSKNKCFTLFCFLFKFNKEKERKKKLLNFYLHSNFYPKVYKYYKKGVLL